MSNNLKSLLSQLNDEQRKATTHKDGPLMVIAGAGSGKTRVLTFRIAYLMEQGIDAFSILALTFTNKAAREMKERIAKIVGESEAKNLWMGTFHSIFARVLRAEADKLGFPNNFTIYDAQDSERLIASIIKEMQLDKNLYKPKTIKNRISSFKNSLITVKAYYNHYDLLEQDRVAQRPKMGEIYEEYVNRCFKSGVMDFDDLLLRTNELLNVYPEVLAKYQNKFKYILVDEYQDTNHSQYLIVRALADRFQNICVVGDDAQSIYSFRGANINNILSFQKDYENAALYRLEQNYRSTQNIVSAANSVIQHNKSRLEKNVWTDNIKGEKIKVQQCINDAEEGRFISSSIFDFKSQYQKKNIDFAVLYRTNTQSRAIEESLRKYNIPYRIFGGISFYQRKEIKDILAYLRLIVNQNDEENLKRIINYPIRGIGSSTVNKLIIAAKKYNCSIFEVLQNLDKYALEINEGTKNKLTTFRVLIESLRVENEKMNAFDIANLVIKKTQILKEINKDDTPEEINRTENIQELLNGIRDFTVGQEEVENATGQLSEFLEEVALITDLDLDDKKSKDCVSLMTIHMAKGLEFPYVFIVGLEENLFPSPFNLNNREDLEEERRLFYVALTRAKKGVFLSYALSRYRFGKLNDSSPSRFINEIDNNYLDNSIVNNQYENKKWVDPAIFGAQKQYSTNDNRFRTPKNSPTFNETNNFSQTSISKFELGQKVEHTRFGKGKILVLEGSGQQKKALIDFETVGQKKLLLFFAKLKIID